MLSYSNEWRVIIIIFSFFIIEIVYREVPRSEGSDEKHQRHVAGQVVNQCHQRLDADTSGAD